MSGYQAVDTYDSYQAQGAESHFEDFMEELQGLQRMTSKLRQMLNSGVGDKNIANCEAIQHRAHDKAKQMMTILKHFSKNSGDLSMQERRTLSKLSRQLNSEIESIHDLQTLLNDSAHNTSVDSSAVDIMDKSAAHQQQSQMLIEDDGKEFLQYNEDELVTRAEAMQQLQQDTLDILQMQQDMGQLIDLNSANLNIIEDQVSTTRRKVSEGIVQLDMANDSQGSARKSKCCIAFIVIAILTILILLMYWTLS